MIGKKDQWHYELASSYLIGNKGPEQSHLESGLQRWLACRHPPEVGRLLHSPNGYSKPTARSRVSTSKELVPYGSSANATPVWGGLGNLSPDTTKVVLRVDY